MSSTEFYRLLTATVVPRPIAWVSTVSSDGIPNLAPRGVDLGYERFGRQIDDELARRLDIARRAC